MFLSRLHAEGSGDSSRSCWITTIELLIVVLIIGIVAGLSVFNARNTLMGERTRGAATALQQMLWQGSTSASARFENVVLAYKNGVFTLTGQTSKTVLRTEPLPLTVSTNFPTSSTLIFTPTGRIDSASYASMVSPLQVSSTRITYSLDFSIIGESKMTVSQ